MEEATVGVHEVHSRLLPNAKEVPTAGNSPPSTTVRHIFRMGGGEGPQMGNQEYVLDRSTQHADGIGDGGNTSRQEKLQLSGDNGSTRNPRQSTTTHSEHCTSDVVRVHRRRLAHYPCRVCPGATCVRSGPGSLGSRRRGTRQRPLSNTDHIRRGKGDPLCGPLLTVFGRQHRSREALAAIPDSGQTNLVGGCATAFPGEPPTIRRRTISEIRAGESQHQARGSAAHGKARNADLHAPPILKTHQHTHAVPIPGLPLGVRSTEHHHWDSARLLHDPGGSGSKRGRSENRLQQMMINSHWAIGDGHSSVQEIQELPLHVKSVKALTVQERLDILGKHACDCRETWGKLLSRIENASKGTRHYHAAQLSAQDIETLLRDKLITRCAPTECNTRVFCVTEQAKQRRRLILHPPEENDKARKAEDWQSVELPSITQCLRRVNKRFGATADFRAYYHQFAMKNGGYSFKWIDSEEKEHFFSITTIPTGHSLCPLVAQLYSCAFMHTVQKTVLTELGVVLEFDVYIDNIRWVADDKRTLDAITRIVFRTAEEFQLVFNESIHDILKQDGLSYVFLGVEYNHELAQTSLCTAYRQKLTTLRESFDTATSDPTVASKMTLREILQMFGRLMYANAINGLETTKMYYPMKFLRRRTGCQLDAPAHLWPSTFGVWKDLISDQLTAPPRQWRFLLREAPKATIFTDASTLGCGAVVIADGKAHIYARRWTLKERLRHINILEAQALAIALHVFGDLLHSPRYHIEVYIDNTSVLGNLNRQKAPPRGFEFAQRLKDIKTSRIWPQVTSTQFIRSEANPSDWLSRLQLNQEGADEGARRLRQLNML